MSARRGLYFQMCRWDRGSRGDAAADASFVRACGASEDPRLVRLMSDWCADRLAEAARAPRPAGRRTAARDPFLDLGESARD